MNVLSLFLPGEPLDAFVYFGHLWVVGRDRVLRTLALGHLVDQLCKRYPQHETAYRLAFERNDWLSNAQARVIFSEDGLRRPLERLWRNAGRQPCVADDVSGWREIANLSLTHFQDCRFYAMTAYFAGREGVFAAGLQATPREDQVGVEGSFEKVFDAPVVSLSAKAGELIMSAGTEGLFHGTVQPRRAHLTVQRSITGRSIRTSWKAWDIVNYTGGREFEYLRNEWEQIPAGAPRHFRFSADDESNERVRITSFAASRYGAQELGVTAWKEWERAVFAQATNQTCVIVLDDNSCIWLGWNTHRERGPYLTRRRQSLPRIGTRRLGTPISMAPLSTGFVVEYFDRVYLVGHGAAQLLECQPALSVRTFLPSRRFRCLVLVVREDGVALHAVLPQQFGKVVQPGRSSALG